MASPSPVRALLVGAVIVHDAGRGEVLLLRRGPNARFGQGLWDLPTGKCDAGESVSAAAVRELAEETGVVVAPEDLALAGVIHGAWGVESPDGFVTVVFRAGRWSGRAWNREPGKHAEVAWTAVGAVPEAFVPSTSQVLRAYLAGREPQVVLRGWSGADGAPPAAR